MADRLETLDRALLERAVAGDTEAFALIYRRYQQVVYRFGCSMTGSQTAAEDITQEVFVALFRDLAKYDADRASFTTYLYGVVRNLSRERLRRERRFLSLEILGTHGSTSSYSVDPTEALEGAELSARIRDALRKLPERYRELVVLCDLHGLSYADAALVVNISTPAVRSRLHRGRQLLRKYLSRLVQPARRRAANPERCAI
jgi:RNA polymerase sigma-70 factor (ECF subfamily)